MEEKSSIDTMIESYEEATGTKLTGEQHEVLYALCEELIAYEAGSLVSEIYGYDVTDPKNIN